MAALARASRKALDESPGTRNSASSSGADRRVRAQSSGCSDMATGIDAARPRASCGLVEITSSRFNG